MTLKLLLSSKIPPPIWEQEGGRVCPGDCHGLCPWLHVAQPGPVCSVVASPEVVTSTSVLCGFFLENSSVSPPPLKIVQPHQQELVPIRSPDGASS